MGPAMKSKKPKKIEKQIKPKKATIALDNKGFAKVVYGIKTPFTLYEYSSRERKKLLYLGHNGEPDQLLKEIAAGIKFRNLLIQQEVFFIGELLVEAKQILRQNNKSFKVWVNENFDFGYHTATNFCNVYIACGGMVDLVVYVKPSVLYRISSKSFPIELRKYLIFNTELDKFSITEIKDIYIEYKEKGFDHVKSKFEEKANVPLCKKGLVPYVNNLMDSIFFIRNKIYNLERRLHWYEDISLRKGATEEGDEIFSIVSRSLKDCLAILINAKSLVEQELAKLDPMSLRCFDHLRFDGKNKKYMSDFFEF